MDDSEPPAPRSRRDRAAQPSTPDTPAAPAGRAKASPAKAAPRKAGTAKATPAKAAKAAAPVKKAGKAAKPSPAAKPAKKAAAKRATPAKGAIPVTTTEPVAPPTTGVSPPAAVPRTPEERAAQTAVERYGSAARTWATRLRTTYPRATPDGLARLAARDHVRLARATGAAAALAGPIGPAAGTGAVLAVQARLVVHVAAAYGVEPTGADILRLVNGAANLRSASVRAVARLVPGAAVVLGALLDGRLLDRLATRAVQHYRSHSSRSFNSV